MSDFFSLLLDNITPDDVKGLLGTPEGQTFEIKGDVSLQGKRPDPWFRIPEPGRQREGPGENSKHDIFRELVAFANSEGGWLVIGLEETKDEPKRVAGIKPLPDCQDLASRLQQASQDLIDPPLSALRCRGIEMGEEEGEGVVVCRVHRSPLAPHRLYIKGRSQEAYKRFNDESKPMKMDEIQDLTLDLARGQERVDSIFLDAQTHIRPCEILSLSHTCYRSPSDSL